MNTLQNPRSVLHALAPYGQGTAQVESLVSYLCRLAVSHSTSVTALARVVAREMGKEFRTDFDWRDRSLSGAGEAAIAWTGALSALTGVRRLDTLTLTPCRQVFAQKGLLHLGGGRWCPQCLHEDRLQGHAPYFRLTWDIKAVTACAQHGIELHHTCPECGRTGVRHKAAYVVPGWCTHCGAFLGAQTESVRASPEALWVAREVGGLLGAQSGMEQPAGLSTFREALTKVVARMDGGNGAAFGARIGVAKSTVHYWVQGKTAITLNAGLRIAAKAGLSLVQLVEGKLDDWQPPLVTEQLDLGLALGGPRQRAVGRALDWEAIRAQLLQFARQVQPVSLAEVARRLEVDASYLYLHANKEARLVGARWREHTQHVAVQRREWAKQQTRSRCEELLVQGRALNLREMQKSMTPEELSAAKHLFDMLRKIKEDLGLDPD